jgi:hypothetical protein
VSRLPCLPPPVVERHGELLIVRDDLLPGGTKRRVLPRLFAAWPEQEFVFGGPAQGYAQVAGAYAARDVGKEWTFFLAKRARPHPLTLEAMRAGARIVAVPAGRLSVVQARARTYCDLTGARFLPLGFDVPEFTDALVEEAARLPIDPPPEVWVVAGSGALSRALQRVWPDAAHYAIRIGFPPDVGAATLLEAPERFGDPAERPPPIPSCANYDAKAWRFISERASPGALWWNVAG